jgi:serine protease Do
MRKLSELLPSLMVLATAVVVLLAGPSAVRQIAFAHAGAQAMQASHRLAQSTILEELNQACRDVAAAVEPSVVHISAAQLVRDRSGQGTELVSSGSGWIYDDHGHIVTNAHVIEDATRIQVQLHTGDEYEAELIGRDVRTDIAVIKIAPGMIIPAQRSSSDVVRQGDIVFAFGSPFDFRFSMSQGVVSGLGRSANLSIQYENFIQVDAAINPGNSGGPLTNVDGRVIGMNTAIATGRGSELGNGQFAGIGLAIPMTMIESVVDQLIGTGEVAKGYLGVERDFTGIVMKRAQSLGFHGVGMPVSAVTPGGPADRGGIRAGDIILRLDDVRIDSFSQLSSIISSKRAGDDVAVTYWRADADSPAGSEAAATVTLAQLEPELNYRGVALLLERLGLGDLATNTPARAGAAGRAFAHGVVIGRVDVDSPHKKSLEAGSVITAVGGVRVLSLDEFYANLDQMLDYQPNLELRVVDPRGVTREVRLIPADWLGAETRRPRF